MADTCFYKFVLVWLIFKESIAVEVHLDSSVLTTIGKKHMDLNCSVKTDSDIAIERISIRIYNTSIYEYYTIATFSLATGNLTGDGAYLKGRANLSQFPIESGIATLSFNEIRCEDANLYVCRVLYKDRNDLEFASSNQINVQILTPPSKPGTIESDTLSSTIKDGQYVTFICQGMVGNPPGRFIWRKRGQSNITTYNDTETITNEIPGQCTFEGTSNLTIQLDLADDEAVIECFEQYNDLDNMTTRTQPLQVSRIGENEKNNSIINTTTVTGECLMAIGILVVAVIWKM